MERWHPFSRKKELTPVTKTLADVESFRLGYGFYGYPYDDLLIKLRTYLRMAEKCELHSQPIVYSCVDLAETLALEPDVKYEQEIKTIAWQEHRETALAAPRAPRDITMNLDPVYFAAILEGRKKFEGRAYKPDSDKNYPDVRKGDKIYFTLSDREDGFTEQAQEFGIAPNSIMQCTVKDMFFEPTVHGMYQWHTFDGDAFQPMIHGKSELLQLQRAGIYYSFPGYPELIREHGFLGIQLQDPCLV